MYNLHTIKTDIAIIGARPVGLFAAFQCGMAGLKCHLIDPLDAPGGQCIALYPEKPIYDVPGFPKDLASELIANLVKQVAPFAPKYHMGETISGLEDMSDGSWRLTTSAGTKFNAGALIIAAGFGAFEPKRPPLGGLDLYERLGHGLRINYFVQNTKAYANKNVVIAGGGDSAVDWTRSLVGVAKSIFLIHRQERFRANKSSLSTLRKMVGAKKTCLYVPYQLTRLIGDQKSFHAVQIEDFDGNTKYLNADVVITCDGLSQKLGPISNWELEIESRLIKTNPTTAQTNQPGLFTIGDIAVYPQKQRLIVTGFSEAAHRHINSDAHLKFQHSTAKGLPQND